ncbi:MAG TPA: glycosyltransferase family 4 protein [Anaerolineae bacterium]|nr:glycosyltransferase family 4 protein [Anaerolineae bacterium]
MRIAMIGPFGLRPKGTMSVRALSMARALVKRGHAVKIVLPPWDHPEDSGHAFEDHGVQIENITLPRIFAPLFQLVVMLRLIKHALVFKPDVIHCFKPKAYAGLSAWWLWQLKRLRFSKVRLIIDSDDWEGAGGWNDRGQYSWLQKKFFAWQERWGLKHNDGLTLASRALQTIVWSMGLKPDKVMYVPNGIANADFGTREAEATSPRSVVYILLYTRFFEYSVDRVLEVFRRVVDKVPQAHLLVVGKGFHEEEQQLLEQARQIGLHNQIDYIGWVDPDALPGFFAQARVAIYPFDDTLINRTKCAVKLIDLLAAGVPVVADAVGQNMEYIRHNQTGWLVTCGNVEAMAEAVVSAISDPNRAKSIGTAAMQDMYLRFDWDRLVESVETIYQGKLL